MTLISAKDSPHDFISPSMCIAIVASLTREMAARSFAYHAHGTTVTNPTLIHGLCAMTKQISLDRSVVKGIQP